MMVLRQILHIDIVQLMISLHHPALLGCRLSYVTEKKVENRMKNCFKDLVFHSFEHLRQHWCHWAQILVRVVDHAAHNDKIHIRPCTTSPNTRPHHSNQNDIRVVLYYFWSHDSVYGLQLDAVIRWILWNNQNKKNENEWIMRKRIMKEFHKEMLYRDKKFHFVMNEFEVLP